MIFRSPDPDVAIPEIPLTQFLLERLASQPEHRALIDGPTGRAYTSGQLADAIERAAAGLAGRDFGKGDVMAILSPNLPEYAIAFHAVSRLGGSNTTVNPLYTLEELIAQLADAGATHLVTVPPFLDKALAARERLGLREIFVFGQADGAATPFSDLLATPGPAPSVPIDPRQDVVALPYSSGTTGLPKGVMLTHYNLVANISQTIDAIRLEADERVLAVLPFFHIYGMTVLMNMTLYQGATVVTMPRFDLEQFLQTIQQFGVTRVYAVPPIVLALAKHPLVDQYDLSSVKTVFSGAAPLGPDVAEACARRLGCIVKQGYGLTETSPVTHCVPDRRPNKPGSVGQLVPRTECRIVDLTTGQEVGPNQPGEIRVRGPQVMKGYLNNLQATAEMLDAEGWLRTGDIGYADDEGYFYVVDRVKELIKYKGFQVAPAELEALLLTHPAVADAAVIPIPDEEAGEVPKAYVVLKGEATPSALMAFVAEHLAHYKHLRAVELVDQIPKSASGKILRRVLVERERERAAGVAT